MKKALLINIRIKILLLALLCAFMFQSETDALPKNTNAKNIKWKENSIGMYGGVVNAIVQSPDKKYLYAGTYQRGIFRTIDDGRNWLPVNAGLKNLYINDLLSIDKALIAGTNGGVYYSQNGEEWQKSSMNLLGIIVFDLEGSKTETGTILFAATNQGLYKTTTYDGDWVEIGLPQSLRPKVLAIDPSDNNILYASGDQNVLLKTDDRGLTWTRANQLEQIGEFESLAVNPRHQNVLYGGTLDRGFFVSENFGSTWTNKSKGLKNVYVNQISPLNEPERVLLSTYDGLYEGNPFEENWVKVGTNTLNDQFISICQIDKEKLFVGTNGCGVYYTELTTKQWEKRTYGINNCHIRSLLYDPYREYIIAGTWGAGLFKSLDEGKSWQEFNKDMTNPYIISSAISVNQKMYIGTYNGGLFRLGEDGISWKHIDTLTLSNYYIFSIAPHPSKANVMYVGTANGVYKTIDEAKTWIRLNLGSEDLPVGEIMDLQINPLDEDFIIAGSSTKGIYISKDAGQTWFSSGLGISNNHILSLAMEPKTKTIYATTFGSGVFISENMGASWTQSNTGLNSMLTYNIILDSFNSTHLILSTETGVYLSLTKGKDWLLFGSGLEFDAVRDVIFLPNDDRFICGTFGKGVYKALHFPSSPIPMDPMNGAKITKRNPMLRWTESSDSDFSFSYHLQIAKDQEFEKVIFENANVSGDQFQIPDLILEQYQKYFWRIRTQTPFGSTEWSKNYSFDIVTVMILKINSPLISINGSEMEIEKGNSVFPTIQNGRTFLPIRVIIENLGGSIGYEPKHKKILILLETNKIELQIGNYLAIVNGVSKSIEAGQKNVVPFVKSGRTFLPLRFVAENSNTSVEWNAKEETITLVYPERKK